MSIYFIQNTVYVTIMLFLSSNDVLVLLYCVNLLLAWVQLAVGQPQQAIKDSSCYDKATLGQYYDGYVNVTSTGVPCQRWNRVSYINFDHNYCRNPDLKVGGPWCYHTNAIGQFNNSWDYCFISVCKSKG